MVSVGAGCDTIIGDANVGIVIFPFHPISIYLNPNLLKYLLDPLYINQESGNWPKTYTIHDIGSSFPNATGQFLARPS